MPIYNQYKETCDALSISLTILNKLINKSYDAKLKPHLDSKYLSIERIETERAYLTPKQPKKITRWIRFNRKIFKFLEV